MIYTRFGRGCGFSEETKDYPYLYWPKLPDVSSFLSLTSLVDLPDISSLTGTEQEDATAAFEGAAADFLNSGVCVKTCP
jgi:hypothetical protein